MISRLFYLQTSAGHLRIRPRVGIDVGIPRPNRHLVQAEWGGSNVVAVLYFGQILLLSTWWYRRYGSSFVSVSAVALPLVSSSNPCDRQAFQSQACSLCDCSGAECGGDALTGKFCMFLNWMPDTQVKSHLSPPEISWSCISSRGILETVVWWFF
jgi:hypothetical protein